jgi:hypothetical protein
MRESQRQSKWGNHPVRQKRRAALGPDREVPRFGGDKKWQMNPWVQPIVAPNPMRRTKAGWRSAFASEPSCARRPRSARERQRELGRRGSVQQRWRSGAHAVLG